MAAEKFAGDLNAHAPQRRAPNVALAHDYLAAVGGAERVVLSLVKAFPGAPLYTSLYEPDLTYSEFRDVPVSAGSLNRSTFLRRHYRLSLPLLPWAFGRHPVEADVVICSSSGWSHGIATDAPKIVYCHNPARWLYQRRDYTHGRKRYLVAASVARPLLLGWDQQAANSCARYLANSRAVAQRIAEHYDRDAEVLPPPVTFDPGGEHEPVTGVEPGYVLSVGRLLPYKHVGQVVAAFERLGARHRLVVAGEGPLRALLEAAAGKNVQFVGRVSDGQLRWLYANSTGTVSASHEDFGLTPVEGGMFGKPAALLRHNGFLDTTIEGINGIFFDQPDAISIAQGVRAMAAEHWTPGAITRAADRFSFASFQRRLHAIVGEVVGAPSEEMHAPVAFQPERHTASGAANAAVAQ
jgi:glycosyltransferase involved in cell wall biosynthesis